jgi:protein SCO1/2
MNSKAITLVAYGLPALLIGAVLAFTILRPIQVLPRVGIGPGYGLIDVEGNRITNETMRGKIVLYSFTYTHCPQVCSTLMEKMQAVRSRMAEISGQVGDLPVEIITISIDPERDTPEKLAEYAAQYGATPESNQTMIPWYFITGNDPELTKIMVSVGFDLYHEKVPAASGDANDYTYKFVPMVVLIDGWGIIRSEYRQYETSERLSYSEGRVDIDPDIVLRDIGLVSEEANNSTGVASAAYGAAHLFLCYPP